MQLTKTYIVFAVCTESQLMFALNIIAYLYNSLDYNIKIIRLSPYDTIRLSQSFNFKSTGIEYSEIRYSLRYFKDKRLKDDLKKIFDLVNIEKFYFFNEYNAICCGITSVLSKKKIPIALGPDGLNVYARNLSKDKFFSFRSRLKLFVQNNLYLWSNKIVCLGHLNRRWYGGRRDINEVIVEYPDKYVNNSKKKVVSVPPICQNSATLCLCNQVFQYRPNCTIPPKSILWIDQPFPKNINEKKIPLLKRISEYCDRPLYIKPHPKDRTEELQDLKEAFPNHIIEENYPVELLIANLTDVYICSWTSASLMFYNKGCRYYYVYKILEPECDSLLPAFANLFQHIEVPLQIEEIK